MVRLVGLLCFGAVAALGCDCEIPPVPEAVQKADVVFRGTIVAIRDRTVFFRVRRVWKGDVSEVFSMPEFREMAACRGFRPAHLQTGNDLVVYADRLPRKRPDGRYFTSICTRTEVAKNASEDLRMLGPGRAPHREQR